MGLSDSDTRNQPIWAAARRRARIEESGPRSSVSFFDRPLFPLDNLKTFIEGWVERRFAALPHRNRRWFHVPPKTVGQRGQSTARPTLIWLDLSIVYRLFFLILFTWPWSRGLRRATLRRWISLIFAGWLPHERSPVRGCLVFYITSVTKVSGFRGSRVGQGFPFLSPVTSPQFSFLFLVFGFEFSRRQPCASDASALLEGNLPFPFIEVFCLWFSGFDFLALIFLLASRHAEPTAPVPGRSPR